MSTSTGSNVRVFSRARACSVQCAATLAAVLLTAGVHGAATAQARDRSGEQVVQSQCVKCHATGENGAPKIGDKAAWTPRLSHGLDTAVRAAIAGHGSMPARGGMADLTDPEVRSAVIYMFNPVSAVTVAAKNEAPLRAPGGNIKVVSGVEIDLGVVPAESLRVRSGLDGMGGMHAAPKGKGFLHLNVSLFDNQTRAAIMDADVKATVKDPVMGDQTHRLEAMVINGVTSYGTYFRRPGTSPYKISVQVRRPKAPFVEAEFNLKR